MLAGYYQPLKVLHVGAVCVSVGLFIVRGALRLAGFGCLQRPWLRVGPHVVDTLLLASAIALTSIVHQYPIVNGWLTAKLLGLVAYVVLGSIALRRGRTPAVRATALAAALVVVAYIIGTALHHDPDPRRW